MLRHVLARGGGGGGGDKKKKKKKGRKSIYNCKMLGLFEQKLKLLDRLRATQSQTAGTLTTFPGLAGCLLTSQQHDGVFQGRIS